MSANALDRLKEYIHREYHYNVVTMTFTVAMDKTKLSKVLGNELDDIGLFYELGVAANTNDIKLVDWIEAKE